MTTRTVGNLALTRSGDKGADANVGVWTSSELAYRLLDEQLTADVVGRHFAAVCRGPVRRYPLANLRAFNFVLGDALDGGGSSSLRSDAQGKVYGLAMALIPIEVPDDLALGDLAPGDLAPGDLAPGDPPPGDLPPGNLPLGDTARGDSARGRGGLGGPR